MLCLSSTYTSKLFLFLSSFLFLSGVCLSSRIADDLCCGHRLPVRPTHVLQYLPSALGLLAPLLWPLASYDGGLPLLQGHHYLPRTPAQGTKLLIGVHGEWYTVLSGT